MLNSAAIRAFASALGKRPATKAPQNEPGGRWSPTRETRLYCFWTSGEDTSERYWTARENRTEAEEIRAATWDERDLLGVRAVSPVFVFQYGPETIVQSWVDKA